MLSLVPSEKPLSAASRRLRRKSGRPRAWYKSPQLWADLDYGLSPQDTGRPASHSNGTVARKVPKNQQPARRTEDQSTVAPLAFDASPPSLASMTQRLLSVKDTARYLGVSVWTIRTSARHLAPARAPLPFARRLVRYDRLRLDVLIEAWRRAQ